MLFVKIPYLYSDSNSVLYILKKSLWDFFDEVYRNLEEL